MISVTIPFGQVTVVIGGMLAGAPGGIGRARFTGYPARRASLRWGG